MPATPKRTNNKNVAARIMRLVVTLNTADPKMTAARTKNMSILIMIHFLLFFYRFNILANIQMLHEFVATKNRVFEFVHKLDGIMRTSVDTKFAEHALAQIILIINEYAFFLSIFGFHLFRSDFDCSVRTSHLTEFTSNALVVALGIMRHDKSSTVTLSNMLCMAILGILLSNFLGEIFTPSHSEPDKERLDAILYLAEI